jgi:hypothetical protein
MNSMIPHELSSMAWEIEATSTQAASYVDTFMEAIRWANADRLFKLASGV